MDMTQIMQLLTGTGGLGLIAIAVYRAKDIIGAVQSLNDSTSNKIMETHDKALKAYSEESVRRDIDNKERFAFMQTAITRQNENMAALVGEVKVIGNEIKTMSQALYNMAGEVTTLGARVEVLTHRMESLSHDKSG